MPILVFSICLVVVAPSKLTAQEDATLRVVVNSAEDGNPVIGANVLLLDPDKPEEERNILHGGATDSDGLKQFDGVSPGRYLLEVSFIGYETHQEVIELEESDLIVKRVVLPVSREQLDEIVVEGERNVTTGEAGIHRISSTDIGRVPTPASGGDVASYLQTLPSVASSGDRGGELYIRGGTPSQNQVLIDNLPITKPFHISNMYSAFPQQTVQSVDMYAGGFGAEYMGATSAIIDVSLRPGNMREYSGSAGLGSQIFSLQMEGPIETDRHSFMLMGRKSMREYASTSVFSDNTPTDFYDFMGRYTYQGDRINCNVTGINTFDRGQISRYRNVELSWSNTVLGGRCLAYEEMFQEPIEFTIGYSSFTNEEGPPGNTERSASMDNIYLRLDHSTQALSTPVDYGFGVKLMNYSALLDERFSNLETFETGQAVLHGHMSAPLEPTDALKVEPSVGFQFTLTGVATLEPRLRMAYRLGSNNNQEISLAMGKYSQIEEGINDERNFGTVFNVYRPNGSDEPLQKALHGLIGYQRQIGNNFRVNLDGYIKRHQNIPVSKWSPEAALEIETALADGLTYGFETRMEYNNNPFYLSLGYGWSKVEYEAATDNLGAWIEEPIFSYSPAHDRRHKLNLIGSYNFAGFTASVKWEFKTGKPYTKVYGFDLQLQIPEDHPLRDSGTARTLFDRPYSERLPTFHRLDVSIEKSFRLSSVVQLNAEIGGMNLYDRDNIFYFDANTLQRVNQTPIMPYFSIETQIN